MDDPRQALLDLLHRDKRYPFDAYSFVFEALTYAHENLGLGTEYSGEQIEGQTAVGAGEAAAPVRRGGKKRSGAAGDTRVERHLSGQELCEAIRLFAVDQFGYMAKSVLNHWGITQTGDFGEIVFNLIGIKQMRKTRHDRREHFEDVYDFDEAFVRGFQFPAAKK